MPMKFDMEHAKKLVKLQKHMNAIFKDDPEEQRSPLDGPLEVMTINLDAAIDRIEELEAILAKNHAMFLVAIARIEELGKALVEERARTLSQKTGVKWDDLNETHIENSEPRSIGWEVIATKQWFRDAARSQLQKEGLLKEARCQ